MSALSLQDKQLNKAMDNEKNKSHVEWMHEAVLLAAENLQTLKGGPFGAVVVKDGKIVGKGSNSVTSLNDPTAHAEVMAIRDACRNLQTFQLEGCIIYSSCEPCPMCLGAIYWARPAGLYYAADRADAAKAGFDDSYIYDQLPLPAHARDLPAFQLDPTEAVEVFNKWNNMEVKTPY